MIITISGLPGSGKTSVARELAARLGYKHYSVGDLRGEIAQKHGMTIDELNEVGKTKDWTDKEADDLTKKRGEEEDDFVIDGWLAFHFIPHSVKIFLDVDADEAAERVFKKQRPDEAKQETVEGMKKMQAARLANDQFRYQKYYKVDFLDKAHYDLLIDTTGMSIEEVVDKVMEYIKSREEETSCC